MQREEFNALGRQGFNRIPLVKEVLADLETPLSLYVKLTQAFGKTNTYLLESVLGGERFGRFSFIGLPAKTIFKTIGTPTAPVNEAIPITRSTLLTHISSALRLLYHLACHVFVVVLLVILAMTRSDILKHVLPNIPCQTN